MFTTLENMDRIRTKNRPPYVDDNHIAHNKGYQDGYLKGLTDGKDKQIQELRQEILSLKARFSRGYEGNCGD